MSLAKPMVAERLERPVSSRGHSMQIRGLSAYYGAKKAVDGITMDIPANHITALIGPSGCGKSTVIRCLNRMHEVVRGARAEGEVLLDGENIYGPGIDPVQVRRLIGMVFQKPNPFPMMSVYDNVIAGLKLNGRLDKREADAIVERSLRQAALWDEVKDKLQASGAALSGGQQQRLCIARTLAVEPEVILMDEPASALDPISTLKIEDLMQELRERYTIVVVTHNMQQAARVSDFTAFMLAGDDRVGRLVEVGPTDEMFTRPTEKRTEDYITGRFG
ncbi:MAG: phosphate ABC transporter ATP-binding protein [Anaerolineae bacterium]|nr:phosphate ABC transporter ATP-binding protein [Anaerolineae bacterium]